MRGVASLTGSISPTMVAKIVIESMIATPEMFRKKEKKNLGLSNQIFWIHLNGEGRDSWSLHSQFAFPCLRTAHVVTVNVFVVS